MANQPPNQSPEKPPRKKRGCLRSLLIITGLFFGLPVLFSLGMFRFVQMREQRANELWDAGNKQEAVEIYTAEIERSSFFDSLSVKRTAEFHFENGEKGRARHFLNIAIENDMWISLEPKELSDLYQEMRATRSARLAQERKRRDESAKAEAEAKLAKENAEFEKQAPVEGNTPKDETLKLRRAIADVVGTDGLSFNINDHLDQPKFKVIQVRFDVEGGLFGAKLDAMNILKTVAFSDVPYAEVTIFGSSPLVDSYRNTSNDVIVKMNYSGSTIAKINWNSFLADNVFEIADDAWLHPAARN